jgi:serine/threonine protein kinase
MFLLYVATSHRSYVALKIATAFWTERYPDHEASILRRIQEINPTHPGRSNCPHLIDQFRVESEHGEHTVFVTLVSGPSVFTVQRLLENDKKRLPLPVLKQWLREMLMALDYIHTEVGVIHSGKQGRTHRID